MQDHPTRVASVAASFHYPYRGMAYGATIISAGHDNNVQLDAVEAYRWAMENQDVDVVNFSQTIYSGSQMSGYDMAFDYWAYQGRKLLVTGAGNDSDYVGSPAKAWNVLAVGAYDDKGTIEWAGDEMAWFSSYKNPASPWNDREKPEVVAPGVYITALGLGNNSFPSESGTSYATGHVTGLEALLIDRDQQLTDLPEVTKAIIMASATHNIEGYPIIMPPFTGDQRDGAGGINAELAYETARTKGPSIAPCLVSCWWHELITNSNLPVGGDLTHTFYAEQGELIRVAISWWSNVSQSGNDYNSQLDTDLDLVIKDPDGSQVTSSLSGDNNYELVQFFALKTGIHTINVHKTRADEDTNFVGIAVVKNIPSSSIYLPIIFKNFTPAVSCPNGQELIVNGGFEAGKPPWVEYSRVGYDLIINAGGARSGSWYAYMAGYPNTDDKVYQDFVLPVGSQGLTLEYSVSMGTYQSNPPDYLYARVKTTSGQTIRLLDQFDSTETPWVWYDNTVLSYNWSSYAGQTLRLSFDAVTDGSGSIFSVDEVSLKVNCFSGSSVNGIEVERSRVEAGPALPRPIEKPSELKVDK